MLYTRNHDTSWFYHFNGYTKPFFAFEAVHALFGIPEIFAGDPNHPHDPDADPTVFGTYAKYFQFRRENPVFSRGEVRLRAVSCDNAQVFAGARTLGPQTGLGLVSFSGTEQPITLTVGTELNAPATISFRDVLSGETVPVRRSGTNGYRLTMKPYQILAVRY